MLSSFLIGVYVLGCVLSLLMLLARIDFKGSEIDDVFGVLMVLSSWMGFGYLCFVWRKERMSDE